MRIPSRRKSGPGAWLAALIIMLIAVFLINRFGLFRPGHVARHRARYRLAH